MSIISKKICLIGDFGVGKTSLIRRFVDQQFSDQYLASVGVKISQKTLELNQANQSEYLNLRLLIWDLEGYTKFNRIALSYLRGASGAVVVADVTRQETIKNLSEHIQLFLSVNPEGSIIVAFNKSDLISEERLAFMAQKSEFKELDRVVATYQTSAKTGAGVNEIFQALAGKMMTSGAPLSDYQFKAGQT